MGSIWDDRLAEVWAPPGWAGSGVVIGTSGVLTARHVVAEVVDGAAAAPVLARVIRRGSSAAWVPMHVTDTAPEWDLAVLEVDRTQPESTAWLRPSSPSPVVVMVSGGSEEGCEAVGFPDEEVQRPEMAAGASEWVRQSEQVRGTLSPMGQAKPPVAPHRGLPNEWMPLDADTTTPGEQKGWLGMSGAGMVLADGRLAGTIVDAEAGHQQRRLYVVPLAAALAQSADIAAAVAAVVGTPVVPEVAAAPLYRRLLYPQSLGADGVPLRLNEVIDLGVFGVKPVDLADEPPYLNYVPRDDDGGLHGALGDAVAAKRVLLLVGDSGSGKSRSAAEAARHAFPAHRLLRPQAHQLTQLADVILADLAPTLVWLDDMEKYAHPALREILERLLDANAIVVATIRREELKRLTSTGEVHNPSGEALTDERLVLRFDWKREWSQAERDRITRHVANLRAREAVAAGLPLGVWAVAGPQLVHLLNETRSDEDYPYRFALVRTVLDWYRAGMTTPIPRPVATDLINEAYLREPPDDADITEAIVWCTQPIKLGGRKARYSLLTSQDDGLAINEYIQDHDAQHHPPAVPDATWSAALANASGPESLFSIGLTAVQADHLAIWQAAMQALAEGDGDSNAGMALGKFAEQQVAKLPPSTANLVDRMLLRLLRVAVDSWPAERQRVYKATLQPAEWRALKDLADARLIFVSTDSAGRPYATLITEALINFWPRLRLLVDENAEFLMWLADVQQRATDQDLLPAAQIAEARYWLDTRPDDIPTSVKTFIEYSQTAAEARLRE